MTLIHGARRSGKTMMLMDQAKRDSGIVLVRHRGEMRRLAAEGVKVPMLTFDQARGDALRGLRHSIPLHMDGLDEFLFQLFMRPVSHVTLDRPGRIIHLSGGIL